MIKGDETVLNGFKSLIYRSGWLYNAITRRLYDQDKKFLTIAKLIGKGPKRVLDLPCGTGYLMRFLHPLIEYEGVDLNHRFLKRIKNKELNLGSNSYLFFIKIVRIPTFFKKFSITFQTF